LTTPARARDNKPGANSRWLARSHAAVWHPCTQMKHHETLPPLPIARAEGVWLTDFDGRRYLDGVASWWVNLFGHSHPRIVAAIEAQLRQLDHVMLAGFTHAPAIELAERLAALAPAGLGHAFYASDGASAVEIALKMSVHSFRNRGMPGKRGIVHLADSYHGETLGALSVTDVAIFRDAYAPLLMPQTRLESPVPQPGESPQAGAARATAALARHLDAHHASVAALIVEPLVQGAAGMRFYDPAFLREAAALCRAHGVHLIADEIMTGFGRTGTLFACEAAGVAPDLVCLSKGITGGTLPLSAVLASDDIYAAFYDDAIARGFLHSHSYTGNPLACAAALAVLDLFADGDVIAANRAKGLRWDTMLAALAAHPKVRGLRRLGMIVAFEVDSARGDFTQWFAGAALAQGLLLRPIGRTVYFMPPYVIDDAEFALLCERTRDIVERA
jgi:adenosylmethionine---8-amino-7-oxononanoate aminotransferase